MEKVFYKKGTSILVIAAILVIVLLLCMLLTFLAQQASFDQRIERINNLIAQAEAAVDKQQEIIEFKKTDAYIIEWAMDNGFISEDDYLLVKDYLSAVGD